METFLGRTSREKERGSFRLDDNTFGSDSYVKRSQDKHQGFACLPLLLAGEYIYLGDAVDALLGWSQNPSLAFQNELKSISSLGIFKTFCAMLGLLRSLD